MSPHDVGKDALHINDKPKKSGFWFWASSSAAAVALFFGLQANKPEVKNTAPEGTRTIHIEFDKKKSQKVKEDIKKEILQIEQFFNLMLKKRWEIPKHTKVMELNDFQTIFKREQKGRFKTLAKKIIEDGRYLIGKDKQDILGRISVLLQKMKAAGELKAIERNDDGSVNSVWDVIDDKQGLKESINTLSAAAQSIN